jgi:hypothetical protein
MPVLSHAEKNAPLPLVQERDGEAPRHQLLGLTIPTMERFLVHIGFWGEGSTAEEVRPGTYKRAAEDAWLTDEYGDDLIGYDLATAIRHWLRSHDHDALSVCEVIQEWGWTDTSEEAVNKDGGAEGGAAERARAPPRPAVSQAQVFVSHVQSEPVDLTLERMGRIFAVQGYDPSSSEIRDYDYYWLDYFTLRQCQRDFQAQWVIASVRTIGTVLVVLDAQYLRRSFCILEAYACVVGKGRLLCVLSDNATWSQRLGFLRVRSAEAQTREGQDKSQIDAYIEQTVGHAHLDRAIRIQLKRSIQSFSAMWQYHLLGLGLCCPAHAEWCSEEHDLECMSFHYVDCCWCMRALGCADAWLNRGGCIGCGVCGCGRC